jgi:hypothetical protein
VTAAHRAALGAVLGVTLALAGCTASPTLLDESDFEGIQVVEQNKGESLAFGWTWCNALRPRTFPSTRVTANSFFAFDQYVYLGATIIDNRDSDRTADELLDRFDAYAEMCATSDAVTIHGYSIEPLTGLSEGEEGWRTRTTDGEWGEYVVIKLDDWRLLAVGFTTNQDEPPVDIDELMRLAREGAAEFEPDSP